MFEPNNHVPLDREQVQYFVASCAERGVVQLIRIHDEDAADTLRNFREANEAEGFRTLVTPFASLEEAEELLHEIRENFRDA